MNLLVNVSKSVCTCVYAYVCEGVYIGICVCAHAHVHVHMFVCEGVSKQVSVWLHKPQPITSYTHVQ